MNLSRRSADTLVGLLMVAAIAVLVVTLSITQKWTERRFLVYLRTNSAEDLSVDTKVRLQGLEVGEVASIAPVVDPSMGPLSFLVALRIRERYQDGAALKLPVGTRAEIQPGSVLGKTVVSIVIPPPRPYAVAALQPGDTITAVRQDAALDAIRRVADSLTQQIRLVLTDSRTLISRITQTAEQTTTELAQTGPEVRRTLSEVQTTLQQLRPVLAKASAILDTTDSRTAGVLDSVAATLSSTRALVGHLDSLTVLAHATVSDSRQDIRQTLTNMLIISAKLDHFLDEVSRRPLKMITGVRPLPPESLPAHQQ